MNDWIAKVNKKPIKNTNFVPINKNIEKIKKPNKKLDNKSNTLMRTNIGHIHTPIHIYSFFVWEHVYFPQLCDIFNILANNLNKYDFTLNTKKASSFREFNKIIYKKSSKYIYDINIIHSKEEEAQYKHFKQCLKYKESIQIQNQKNLILMDHMNQKNLI
jgi:hypothetical protein